VLFPSFFLLFSAPWTLQVDQITRGPRHHFFGYIGHVQNIPWNQSGRHIAALETTFQERMPGAADAAQVVLLDTRRQFRVVPLDTSRGWNFQQGTMFYWNPAAQETQLFFNDRDPQTGHVFTVLYDVAKKRRLREYRFAAAPVGNSGVAQTGGMFPALNYARMARLRRVTGYPEAFDWNPPTADAPDNGGVFLVDVATGQQRLLISFAQMVERLKAERSEIAGAPLFINHTFWSRDGQRLFFFIRAHFDNRAQRVKIPCTIRPDGTDLQVERLIGRHSEWDRGARMLGNADKRQAIYDVDHNEVVGALGTPEIFPEPEGDIALSPDFNWLVNGYRRGQQNFYSVFHRPTGDWQRAEGPPQAGFTAGDLRVDGSPNWNRRGDEILFPAIAADGTRQLFRIRIVR